MKKLFLSVFAACLLSAVSAQETVVFRSGEDGYASYRIPALIKNKNGDLIAFSEGRVDHAGDYGNVDIVYKISKDQGKTWGKLNVAADYDKLQAGNVAPVVDLMDPAYPAGRIFLFYNTGNNHEGEVRKGKGLREVWYITSTDGAKTWSEPVNITTQTHRPNQPEANSAYTFTEDWRTYANTPGHGFQFVSGPKKGRIYIAANHSAGDPNSQGKDWNAHAFYSDDHGKTFQLSQNVPYPGTNESTAAQVGENEVYMSSRNQQLNPKQRVISISNDGGETWQSSAPDSNLPDPINQGAVLSWKKGKNFILAHINAADEKNRDNLTLKLSKDKGKTWYFTKLIAKSPEGYKGAYSAYSDIVLMKPKLVGILYEKDNYKDIVFLTEKIK
ncbi:MULTISPECIES: sialidase family protein [Sphingobacterium]|uniref:exo-alpha-sialidase n=1 Tax=Sphingobacterium cellulitidis TaxID=1768011 RepID=A0A8H9KUQ2_9SPHI|nr:MULTISPECIES: sialidase family protein [Sphingobacterium]MBA8987493.1 sialidase-1 [Sphingobacterium soli]WFB63216.1 sialidase family protein [Sphingobacterium sp. WM]GGE24376.1 sialidase [Sphingobacterium soli]